MDMRLDRIGQIAIIVADMDRSLQFYRDVLGMRFLFQAGPALAFLDAGGVRLMLTGPEGAGAPGHASVLYFRVEDIVATHATLLGRGAPDGGEPRMIARMPDHELWIAFVRDPDGNLVGMMQERR